MKEPTPGESALLVVPSRRAQAKILPWRRLYDPEHWRAISPHITVAYPPFVRREAWDAIRPAIARCLAGIKPFAVTLAGLGVFDGPPAVLWFRPGDDGALNRIYASLSAEFPAYMTGLSLPYVPHLTIGFFASQSALAEAQARITVAWQPLRFQVRSLSCASLGKDGIWRVCDELPLGGHSAEQ